MNKPLSPILVRLLAFVIFIAVFSGAYLFFSKKNNQPVELKNDSLTSTTTNQIPEPGSSLDEKPAIIKNKASPTEAPNTSPTNSPEVISAPEKPEEAKIQIGDTTHSVQVTLNTTLYVAMEKLAEEGKITWKTKEFGGLGSFVDSLNGVTSDRMAGKYWIFYVNGEPAKVGISNYILRNNDLIKWNYEDSQF